MIEYQQQTATAGRWLIRNGRLFDGRDGRITGIGQSIVVDQGVVEWIGSDGEAPAASVVIDAAGGTIMPGLINSHVHLANDGAADLGAQVRSDSTATAAYRATANALITLNAGITTVKDCGAADNVVIDLGRAVEAGIVPGPRIVAAGRVITMTGGHGYFMGVEADGTDAVRTAVRGQLKAGAGFIKAMATGGVLTSEVKPTQTSLLREELAVIVQEAHHAGRRVSTHAIGREGIENAIRAGVDTIEHGFHLDASLFALALERGTYLVPTLAAIGNIVAQAPNGTIPPWIVDKARAEEDRSISMFRAAVEAGVNIAAGTDAGTPFNPHDGLVDEIIAMVRIGLTPERALLSATRDGAVNAGLQDLTGTLELGKAADLIVVDGDPLADITALRTIRLVAKAGTVYRDDLTGAAVGVHDGGIGGGLG
ncbi:Imidazolonepropionase [Plantibacter sp. VKM Ac-1784]|uniref:Imidazolonepropionase n=1 Tax=Plantibacter elymi (nom. nud.) TaxID=199708 RepID=A0ABY1RGC0_9MICO|nr:amidohydrolase family protein [Plantibacter sp. VKM Ac-1784]SMQ71168.1 Imidazolonepropionase [Plantibacter sp. VKM Ac-1784]